MPKNARTSTTISSTSVNPRSVFLVQWTVYNNGKGYIGIYCMMMEKTDVFKDKKPKGHAYYGYYLGKSFTV